MLKACNRCKKEKEYGFFYNDRNHPTGKYSICKTCKGASVDVWREANRGRVNAKHREYNKAHYSRLRLTKYKLTLDTYETMMVSQNGLCKVCKKSRRLVIDHCHTTGKVRGLLCHKCNTLISLLDSPELHAAAWVYVKGL